MYKTPIKRLWLMMIVTCIVVFFSFISSCYVCINIVYIRTYVNGDSMLPTLNLSYETTGKRDVVYINRFADIKIDDIVVLDLQSNPNFKEYAIKRLIAMEGDVVNIVFDTACLQYNVTVNGKTLYSKPYQQGGYETYSNFKNNILNNPEYSNDIIIDESNQPIGLKIGKDQVFVLGDNWDIISKDSALYGTFDKSVIVGRVDVVVQPGDVEFWKVCKRIF